MLKQIKSLLILKKLFNHLFIDAKLRLLRYNKNFQNILNITIIDFRNLSKTFIIIERAGYGKEYDSYNDELLYEGEFINGKRNGKWKEYDGIGRLRYEGEYLNGKRNGKGKEYTFGYIYEGEFLDDKRNGKGKIYNKYENNKLYYEGEFFNDKYHGKGKKYDNFGKLEYEGDFLNDKKNGKGKE